jgi:hypothetical protein
MAIVIDAVEEVTVLPELSWTVIVGGPVMVLAAVEAPGCVEKTRVLAAPGSTVNAALSPAVRLSPLVRVAVSTTPLSALVYVTPLMVTWFVPAAMVPVRVPPNVPVPVFKLKLTFVAVLTLAGVPLASWDWTTTGNADPATGLLPLLTKVIASLVVTVNVTPLLATPPTVTTTGPVIALAGTGELILVALQLLGVADTPLKVTVLAPCVAPKFVPLMVIEVPTGPEVAERPLMLGGAETITVLVDAVQLFVSIDSLTAPRSSAHAPR